MPKSNLASISTVVRAVTNEPHVALGLHLFLRGMVELTKADRGAIHRLYLDKSKYISQVEYDSKEGQFNFLPSEKGLDVKILLKLPSAAVSPLEQAILTRETVSAPKTLANPSSPEVESNASKLYVPVVRGQSCLGVLRLESDNERFLDEINPHDIEFARALMLSLFERQASLELFTAVQQPIDFSKPLEEFLEDILLLIADASRMPFIEIHELDDEQRRLRCIAIYGFDGAERSAFDLDPLDAFPPFASAVKTGKPVVESTVNAEQLPLVSQRPEISRVKSFVVAPIRVGTAIFGTLTFGAACPFDYSPLEIAGFESIANGIGTSITNSRNAHRLREISIADARLGLSISGLEVAQAARHEVRGAVDDCVARLTTVRGYLRAPKENREEIEKAIGKFGDQLSNITLALEKIKNASREPDDKLQAASLIEIWRQARALVAAKLEHEHIQTRITHTGKEKEVHFEVLPDSLRHAFLHLLLNSIDAFRVKRAKADRLITVSIDPQSDAAEDVKIRYTDNATGIDTSQFKQWIEADATKDVKTLIFDKGVTTKPSGSGYGLYLARMIIARHHGSIELVSHRGGVVFDITLPKDLRSRMERRETK